MSDIDSKSEAEPQANDVTMGEGEEAATSQESAAVVEDEEKKEEVKLDDLFADVDSDDEFPSSTKPKEEEDYMSDSPEVLDALG